MKKRRAALVLAGGGARGVAHIGAIEELESQGFEISAVVTQAVVENRRGGRSVFLGLFDPSVRPWVGESVLSLAVPMSRMREMCGTMRASCLFGTHAWNKVRDRINK